MIFNDFSFTYLIGLKIINSLSYLIINYLTHRFKIKFSITLGNYLRILSALIDFAILLTLLFAYLLEWYTLAYQNLVIGGICFIFICGFNWIMLARQDETVQAVFIVGVLSMFVLIILSATFTYMGLVYNKGTMPALMLFNGIHLVSWLVFDQNASSSIAHFGGRIGEQLSWVDRLIGDISRTDLALRNVCSFNLGLLNLTYIHTSGVPVNIITLILISFGLLTNILIGLRLIKVSASVKLHNSFMLQIIKHGYSNIVTIYEQLKNKQLPKAAWYAWVITITMGVTFISPCYASAMDPGVGCSHAPKAKPAFDIRLDESLDGGLEPEFKAGISSPVGESALRRGAEIFRDFVEHNQQEFVRRAKSLPTEISIGGVVGGAAGLGTYAASQSGLLGETTTGLVDNVSAEQEAKIVGREAMIAEREAALAKREAAVAAREAQVNAREQLSKSSWFGWFKYCSKGSSN